MAYERKLIVTFQEKIGPGGDDVFYWNGIFEDDKELEERLFGMFEQFKKYRDERKLAFDSDPKPS